ncbi:MAG TPA: hypothetical protein VN948_04115 [Terriglobales bacterium]|nr:hypothetical protein [Terriglobales bacterium]
MSRIITLTSAVFLFAAVLLAQQAPASQPASAGQADSQNADRDQIQKLLTRYQAAYEGRNMAELLAIWPSLQNDQKEQKKIKKEFDRADISSMKVVLELQDMQFPAKDEAVVKSKCNEQYVQVVSTSYSSGDATMGGIVGQRPGPTNNIDKKTVKKTSDIWMTLHRDGDHWTIVSVSDKKPH